MSREDNFTEDFLRSRGLIWNGRHLPYNPKLVNRARKMRKDLTYHEDKIWRNFLRKREERFLKQRPIDNYIVDFYCPSRNLVIEIDGDSHLSDEIKEYDLERTETLKIYGLKETRFTNEDVSKRFKMVCESIASHLN